MAWKKNPETDSSTNAVWFKHLRALILHYAEQSLRVTDEVIIIKAL